MLLCVLDGELNDLQDLLSIEPMQRHILSITRLSLSIPVVEDVNEETEGGKLPIR